MSPAPWYKERLPSKCFQEYSCKKKRYSDALNSQRWQFLKSGLDDFRNGCPPPSDNIIIHGKKGPVPVILHFKKPDPSQIVPYKTWELPTRNDTVFSKLSTSQKAKKAYIAQAERSLREYPLALYSHLQESISPELFCEVMRLLDPEIHHSRVSRAYSKAKDTVPTIQYKEEDEIKPGSSHTSATQFWKPKSRNPYAWFSEKKRVTREEATKTEVPPLDENIKKITKEFCDWVNAMEGEKYNIDEATITNLFDTRYETKSTSLTPIKIVELYHVPAELKACLGTPPSQQFDKSSVKARSESKWEKIKYGAWYLPPKTWKKQKVNEKPAVPDILQNFLNSRKYSKKEEETQPLHGIYAFEEFLELKGYRKPAFLLQMLPAGNAERTRETRFPSRKISIKWISDYKTRSSSLFS